MGVPAKLSICAGDTVKWVNNKAGPHNVVFDEEDIPAGVDQEKISMVDEQLGKPGDSFSMKFDTKGNYGYYCEPHRGAGMQAQMTVECLNRHINCEFSSSHHFGFEAAAWY